MRARTTRWRRGRGLLAVSLAALVAGIVAAVTAAPASSAEEPYAVGATGVTLSGHGYGHGRGMSQWGAYGAARQGLTSAQIIDFYYPGTTRQTIADAPLRVTLSTGTPSLLAVDAAGAMRVEVDGTATALPKVIAATGRTVTAWRLTPDPAAAGLALDRWEYGASAWIRDSTYAATTVTLASDLGRLRLILADDTRREYRGALRAVRFGTGVATLNVVGLEDYLHSVVPSEMPASWSAAALGAQSIAARTYAAYKRARATGTSDMCDTTACQVYSGVASYAASGVRTAAFEAAATDAAIVATAGIAVYSGTAPALTEFSASNGGWTVDGGLPYLVAKPDPYDGVVANSSSSWSVRIARTTIASAWPSVGTPTALVVTGRDGKGEWGGRVSGVRVVGSAGSVTLTGAAFSSVLGLKSTWWTVPPPPAVLNLDVTGDGRADLITKTTDNVLTFYRGRVDGTFEAPVTVSSGWMYLNMFISPGDATRDGVADLWARASDGNLWLYAFGPDGRPVSQRIIGTGWNYMVDLAAAGDRSGDGIPDLYGKTSNGTLWLYNGNGTGGIAAQSIVGTGWGNMDKLLGGIDATGDGIPDLMARQATTGRLWLYAGVAGGGFLDGRIIGTGWGDFTALRAINSPVGGPALLGRLDTGEMFLYPVLPDGTFGTRTSLGMDWNSVALIG